MGTGDSLSVKLPPFMGARNVEEAKRAYLKQLSDTGASKTVEKVETTANKTKTYYTDGTQLCVAKDSSFIIYRQQPGSKEATMVYAKTEKDGQPLFTFKSENSMAENYLTFFSTNECGEWLFRNQSSTVLLREKSDGSKEITESTKKVTRLPDGQLDSVSKFAVIYRMSPSSDFVESYTDSTGTKHFVPMKVLNNGVVVPAKESLREISSDYDPSRSLNKPPKKK